MASSDARGARAIEDAARFLAQLRTGADPTKLGDPSMLPSALPLTTEQSVAAQFGETFATSVFAHGDDGWFGPIESPLGAHVVLILSRQPAHDPMLAEVRDKVRSDWIEARRRDQRETFQARLRQRYDVVVEWPQMYAAQSGE
jgi:hypothetical protein